MGLMQAFSSQIGARLLVGKVSGFKNGVELFLRAPIFRAFFGHRRPLLHGVVAVFGTAKRRFDSSFSQPF
jgi:hypothetical protein